MENKERVLLHEYSNVETPFEELDAVYYSNRLIKKDKE